jgi:catechol 2,3-dioxygenase-like lactoylglutathione lyase family enzyme
MDVDDAVGDIGRYYVQTAYIVPDIDAGEKWFRRIVGVPAWTRFPVHLGAGCFHRGKQADTDIVVSLGYVGERQFELIQSMRGSNIYTEFLETHGYGLHHLGFIVPRIAPVVASLRAKGLDLMSEGVLGGVQFAYFDCVATGSSNIEIIELDADTTAAFDQMKRQARELLGG